MSKSFVKLAAAALGTLLFTLMPGCGGGGTDPLGILPTTPIAFEVQTGAVVPANLGKPCHIGVYVFTPGYSDFEKYVYQSDTDGVMDLLGIRLRLATNLNSDQAIGVALGLDGSDLVVIKTLTYSDAEDIIARLQTPVITINI